jgi:hypothetical protein
MEDKKMDFTALAQTFSYWFSENHDYNSFDDAEAACCEFLKLLGFQPYLQNDVMNEFWNL